MAYSATVTVTGPVISAGRRHWFVTCAETDAAATSEWSFATGLADGACVSIVHYVGVLASGTGTTIQPKYGTAAGVAAIDERAEFAAAAASVSDASSVSFCTSDGKVYIRSTADAGTDNTINTRITFCEGAI